MKVFAFDFEMITNLVAYFFDQTYFCFNDCYRILRWI